VIADFCGRDHRGIWPEPPTALAVHVNHERVTIGDNRSETGLWPGGISTGKPVPAVAAHPRIAWRRPRLAAFQQRPPESFEARSGPQRGVGPGSSASHRDGSAIAIKRGYGSRPRPGRRIGRQPGNIRKYGERRETTKSRTKVHGKRFLKGVNETWIDAIADQGSLCPKVCVEACFRPGGEGLLGVYVGPDDWGNRSPIGKWSGTDQIPINSWRQSAHSLGNL